MIINPIGTVSMCFTQMPSDVTFTPPISDRIVLVASGTDVFNIEVIVLEVFKRTGLEFMTIRTPEKS